MNDIDLKKLQKHQVDMLKHIDYICKKNNIRYFVTWGSALGAVRHGGFIPWDDDIDISMTWENYKKFESIAQKELGNKYFYQSQETDKYCFTNWNKVRINNTTSMERHLRHIKCHYGICIDVFPLIGIPNSSFKRNIQKLEVLIYRFLKYERYLTNRNPEGNTEFKILYGIFPKKFKSFMADKLIKDITKYDMEKCNTWGELLSGSYNKVIFPREFFGKGYKIKFEDMDVIIPEKYDSYLKHAYGDYMTLPKEEDRVGHGDIIVDFDKSYEYYWGN